jgi:hypothetical protein
MKKSNIIVFCTLFAFVCVLGDIGSAKLKNPLKKIDNPFDKKDKKKDKKQEEKTKPAVQPKITAAERAEIENLKKQLKTLKTEAALAAAKPTKTDVKELSEPKTESVEKKIENGVPVTYVTTTQRFKASAAFDQQILLNPSADVIYPGSVLFAHTIEDGSYKEIYNGEKRPIGISYDLTGVTQGSNKTVGMVSGTIVPTKSNFVKFHNTIMSQDIAGKSSDYSYEESTVTDESEFGVKFNFGVGYSTPAIETKVKAGFDFKKSTKKYKHMIKFMETFYTVNVDQGQDTFIYKNFNIADFDGYRPVYVSSIAYGRLAYLTIESDEDLQTVKATIEAAVDVKVSGNTYEGDFETNYNTFKKNNKINITVIGGSVVSTTLDGFLDMLKNDSFSPRNPGKIVAYKLRFVDDNTVANTIYNSEYTVRQTTAMQGDGVEVSFTLTEIGITAKDGNGKNLELYGSCDISLNDKKSSLWNRTRKDQWKTTSPSTHNMNTPIKFSLPNDQVQFNAEVYLREADGGSGGGDDYFTNLMGSTKEVMSKAYQLSNYKDGDLLELKVYQMKGGKTALPNEWVKFNVRINKKYKHANVAGAEDSSDKVDLASLPFQPTKNISIDFTAVSGGSALGAVPMGGFAGTKGQSKALELINFELKKGNIGFEYMGHIQDVGDTAWTSFTGGKGSLGRFGKRMEGVAFRLTPEFAAKYDIYYRGHIQNIGDTQWYKNGEYCGTRGKSLRIEGLQFIIVDK